MSAPKRMKADGLWALEELLWQLSQCYVAWPAAWCPLPGLLPYSAAQDVALVVPWGGEGKFLFSHERGIARFLTSSELLTKPCSPKCPRATWMGFWNCSGLTSRVQLLCSCTIPRDYWELSPPPSSCLASTVSWQMDICQPRQLWIVNSFLLTMELSQAEQFCYLIYQYPMPSLFSDQHLHDPPVQLREWPAGTVHFWEPGQVCAVLDQPSPANIASSPTCKKVFWNLPTGEESLVAGEKAAFTAPSDFLRGVSHIWSVARLLI